ncbi:MAG TPA: LysR family transcriptional regulator substrate-binding protein, partial [Dehalococcoidia bacterium]|nr:LysR family transcriptional regulator substrate-binding protein [Dehalococcoidia bacterium]
RLVVFGRESHYFPLVYEMFKQAGTEPNSSISSDSMEATKHMVEEGLGVSLVPRLAVERELSAGSLVKIPIADSQLLRWPISIIYRKGRKLPHSAQAFLDVMAQRFQQPLVV